MAVQRTGLALLVLSFQTLGIIYSDIGTSPLYVLNGIWSAAGPVPPKEDVIGGISAIVWSLTIIPLLKYAREGGTFALFQGLYPPVGFESAPTYDSMLADRRLVQCKRLLMIVQSLFGTSLTMADGVLTAAVSVTSAVGGIAVAVPSVSSDVIPISIAFLVVLFIAQPFGTNRLSFAFAPITFVWILLLACTGIYNITTYPGIFRAFDPSRAVAFFIRTKNYDYLAGILLAVTGCEALFANLGQFNALSIQISFAGFVYPSLVLAYLGQGSRLISDGPNIISNVFYTSIPGAQNGPLFWIMYVFAILATHTLHLNARVSISDLRSLRMRHTSDTIEGQVYIPAANWILMIGTIIMVAAFQNSLQLSNAYGFAVSTVMFTTTALVSLQVVFVKQRPIILAILLFLFFGFFDGLFWGASLRKVPMGAWVPLTIGCVLLLLMVFWNWAKGLEETFDSRSRRQLSDIIVGRTEEEETPEDDMEDARTLFCLASDGDEKGADEGRRELGRVPLLAVFHRMAHEKGVPHSYISFIRQWPALPTFAIFLTVHVLPVAHVTLEERYVVKKLYSFPGFYGATYYLGYREEFAVEIDELVKRIDAVEAQVDPAHARNIIPQLHDLARSHTHVVPYYEILAKEGGAGKIRAVVNYIRKLLIEDIYRRLRIMFPDTVNWIASPDRIIRIGITARL
ncbi:potassium transporter [Vararia minispora EC-137]|uniref:Potassium transporter n=1 Tax=Vararia minispora EC-137 TaxID=1314806 RepID=A0ACB8QLD2_9AGAM|nr:potassium transporter [Vararia minispora EC-137]